jgi:Tetracyclin repressor-like, C-terminal domain
MQHMVMEDPKQYRWVAREYFEPGFRQLSGLIKRGIGSGEFQPIDAAHTVINIIAMIVFYFSGAPLHGELLGRDALDPRAIAEHKRAVINLLEHGLFRRAARMRPAKGLLMKNRSARTSRARTS